MELHKKTVPLKLLNHIKVILQVSTIENDDSSIDDDDTIDDEQESDIASGAYNHKQAEILILDDKSVQINTVEDETFPQTNISHKLTFDYICDSLETLQKQFHSVMEKLILQQENCCLIRFCNQHKSNPADFTVQLITHFSEQLCENNCKLQHCDLICSDIRMIMLNVPVHNTYETFSVGRTLKPHEGAINRIKEAGVSHNTINHFRNVQALTTWLLHDYSADTVNCHQKLEFIFTVYDKSKRYMFTVKLYLFHIYVNLMNFDDRNHWQQFILHMADECLVETCDIVHNGLTANLLDHMETISSKYSYFMFDIPMGTILVNDTVDILQMADAVIKSRFKSQKGLKEKLTNKIRSNNNNNNSNNNNNKTNTLQNSLMRRKSLLLSGNTTPLTATARTTITPYDKNKNDYMNSTKGKFSWEVADGDFSKNDFDNLRSWYEKIDESFNKLCKSREAYYSEYFDKKNININNLIQAMISHVDSLSMNTADCYMGNNVEKLYGNYKEMKIAFDQLLEGIHGTPYKESLQTYLDTKLYDNKEKACKLQIMYLKKCQADLNENIEQVISKINSKQQML